MLFCCFLSVLERLQVEIHEAGVVVYIGFCKEFESTTAFIKIHNVGVGIDGKETTARTSAESKSGQLVEKLKNVSSFANH